MKQQAATGATASNKCLLFSLANPRRPLWSTRMADAGADQQQPEERGFPAVVARIKGDTLNFILWVSRLLTILFAIGYLLPIFGWVIKRKRWMEMERDLLHMAII